MSVPASVLIFTLAYVLIYTRAFVTICHKIIGVLLINIDNDDIKQSLNR